MKKTRLPHQRETKERGIAAGYADTSSLAPFMIDRQMLASASMVW
jgi:hypothetical protein